MKILLVDVCHTLYRSNTTFDFFDQYFKNNAQYQYLKKLRKNFLVRVILKIFPSDFIRIKAISLLENKKHEALKKAAALFIGELDLIPEVIDAIEDYRTKGYKIVLLSSSLDFIVEAVSVAIKADRYFATSLIYDNAICTGQIGRDLFASKDEIIEQDIISDDIIFITDNRSDLNCAPLVSKLIAVFETSDKFSEAFWKRHHIEDTITYK